MSSRPRSLRHLMTRSLWIASGADAPKWAVILAFVSCVPLLTPYGALYPIEVFLCVSAAVLAARRGMRLRLTGALLLVLLLLLYLLSLAAITDSLVAVARSSGRPLVLLAAAILIADNVSSSSTWLKLVHPVALGCLVLLGVELLLGHPLLSGVNVGYLDSQTLRVQGPIGSGPTAAVLLVASYLAFRARSSAWLMLLLVGIVLTGSRTHVVAAGLMLVLASGRNPSRILAAVLGAVSAAVLAFRLLPGLRDRVMTPDGSFGGRDQVWEAALREAQEAWPVGQPGGLLFGPFQGHNQWLSLALLGGLLGLLVIVLLTGAFMYRSWSSQTLALGVAVLATGFAGEFLVPIIPAEGIGSAVTWMVVTLGFVAIPRGSMPSEGIIANETSSTRHSNQSDCRLPVLAEGVRSSVKPGKAT